MTVAEAIAQLGIEETDEAYVCLAVLDGDDWRNYTLDEVGFADPTEAPALYVASGLFRPGSIARKHGRKADNLARVVYLPFDCDLADWMGFPPPDRKEERAAELAWLWGLPQEELDDLLAAHRADVERAFAAVGLPIHVLICSGYGHYVLVRLADEDQARIADARDAHKLLVARLNEAAGGRLVDRSCSDAGTRVFRVPGSLNRKGAIARTVTLVAQTPGRCPLGQRPKPVPAPAMLVPRSGPGLSDADAAAIVEALKPWWSPGQKHALAVAIPGMLAKAGVPEEQAYALMEAISDAGDRPQERRGGVASSYARARSGANLAGYTALRDRIDPDALAFVDGVLERYRRATVPPTPLLLPKAAAGEEDKRDHEIASAFPPVPEGAYFGRFDEYRRIMGPSSEAPDVFHLGAALTLVGAMTGRRVRTEYASDALYPNLYTVLIGATGSSRKDTAMKRATNVPWQPQTYRTITPTFHISRDVSSAEGIVQILKDNPNTLLYLTELSAMLKNARRKGTQTILDRLIEAWDTPTVLQNLNKLNPNTATNPYLSIIAATQPGRLAREMTDEDIHSGFANRWLYVIGAGKEPLSRPPALDKKAAWNLYLDWYDAIQGYPDGSVLSWDGTADARWDAWYHDVYRQSGRDEDADAMRVRHAVLIQKVALIYAISEAAPSIADRHVAPAIALIDWMWAVVRELMKAWGVGLDLKIEQAIARQLARNGPMHRRTLQRRTSNRQWSGRDFAAVFRAMAENRVIDVAADGTVTIAEGA